jgi:hypothetical protein
VHRFDGQDAVVYAVGDPITITGLPLADCGDGFEWCAADESLRCWLDSGLVFEVWEEFAWRPLEASEVHAAAGCARFERCLTGRSVRVSGEARPTSLVLRGDEWRLTRPVHTGMELGRSLVVPGAFTARLTGLADETWSGLATVRRVLAVLGSASVGAFVGLGELARDAAGATVMFDEQGVVYVPR